MAKARITRTNHILYRAIFLIGLTLTVGLFVGYFFGYDSGWETALSEIGLY